MMSLGLNPSEAEVAEIIHEIDKNKDGKIDFNGTCIPECSQEREALHGRADRLTPRRVH